MDDFELGLSSGSFPRDEFYESFQAPKFYDFINPRDSGNVDEWFFRASILAASGIKELVASAASEAEQDSNSSLPVLKKCHRTKEGPDSSSSMETVHCSENEDPNQAQQGKPVKYLKQVKKFQQKPEEPSPSSQCRTRGGAKPPHAMPATVPQKKILATRKAALEAQRQPASKSLLESFRRADKGVAPAGSQGTLAGVGAKNDRSLEGSQPAAELSERTSSKNYSEEFQESCRRSDNEEPTCRRALGQERTVRGTEAETYVVEQAVMVESAVKLLNLGDEEKSAMVCAEIMGAVCSDGKVAVTQNVKQVFSFTATRKENSKKRKSIDMMNTQTTGKQDLRSKKMVAPVPSCVSPPATLKPAAANTKRPRVTCPQPFRLRTEERGALKEIEFNKRMEHYIAVKDGLCPSEVTSQPKPKIVNLGPVKRRIHRVPMPQPKPDTRSPVEVSIEMLAKDLQKLRTTETDTRDAEDVKTVPRKSKPMPAFDRPFKPQRSTKKLTIPIEPKFHSVHARRTCSRSEQQ